VLDCRPLIPLAGLLIFRRHNHKAKLSMRFEHLDLNLLYALDILLEELSITRASERLHMSQSAMSGVLKRLRDYFEDDLLVQHGRQMQPTAFAAELREPVREIILKVRATIVTKQAFDPASSKRHFRVVTADYAVTVLLSTVIRTLIAEAPHLTFEIVAPDDNSEPLIVRGDVDFLIAPDRYLIEGQPHHLLFEEEFVCVIWEGNSRIKSTLTIEDYLASGHVTVSFGPNRHLSTEEWLMNHHKITRKLEVVSSDFNTLPQLIIGTDRIATMHKRLASYFAQYLPLKILQSPVELPKMKEVLVWNKTMENDSLHQWLREKIIAVATNMN